MKRVTERLIQNLATSGLTATLVEPAKRDAILQRWAETFCPNLHRKTGSWIHLDIRWHAYSYEFETALVGVAARAEYERRAARSLYVDFESEEQLFECSGWGAADLERWQRDIYVFPASLDWTMVYTHEDTLGPYFAHRPSG